jgi:predicted nucleotidyltransferase
MVRIYHGIAFDSQQIALFCQRHGVTRLSLFGSILSDTFEADSDIDVLVEFAPGMTPSLLDLGGMVVELTQMFGRQVDLKTPGFLGERVLRHVQRHRQVQYAA